MAGGLEGHDANGNEYKSPTELWSNTKDADGTHETWYKKAVQYWDQQEASYDGVLGGYGHVSDADVADSRQLLLKVMAPQFDAAEKGLRTLVALDCGAGVGRVSQELLMHHFQEVDLLEPSKHLLDSAQQVLVNGRSKLFSLPKTHRAVYFYCCGLQQAVFEPARYDCIWIQWCLLYLTDIDLLTLFDRARGGLQPDGLIFVKENICKAGFVVDNDDSSLTRSNSYMLEMFEKANMQVLFNVKQRNFPKELFEVRMYALKPRPMSQQAAAAATGMPQ